jgi:hypothetical protein
MDKVCGLRAVGGGFGFAEAEGITVPGEFTEVETGNGADALDRRPHLAPALAAARNRNVRSWWPSSIGSRATWPSLPG